MIDLQFHKAGTYSLGNGSTIEVAADEVVQVTQRCYSVDDERFATVLDRDAKARRKPSERTAVRYVTEAALTLRRAPLLAQGIDASVLSLDDREILIETLTRAEWDAQHAPAPPVETDEEKAKREAEALAEKARLDSEEAQRLADENAKLDAGPGDEKAGASSESVSAAKRSKSKGTAE